MRRLTAGLLGLLAVVLLPLTLVLAWVSVTVTRTEVFVDELGPLIRTPQVQEALAAGAVEAAREQLKVPEAVASQVEAPLRKGVATAIASPQVEALWVGAIRSAHGQFVAIMQGREPAKLDDQGRVVMSFAVALPGLAESLSSVGVQVPGGLAPVVTVPLVPAKDLTTARTAFTLADTVGVWGPVGVAALGVLSVVLARRRRAALGWLAAGWGVGAGLLALALVVVRQPLVDAVPDAVARTVANAVYGLALRGVLTEIGVVAGVVAVLLVGVAVFRGRPAR